MVTKLQKMLMDNEINYDTLLQDSNLNVQSGTMEPMLIVAKINL